MPASDDEDGVDIDHPSHSELPRCRMTGSRIFAACGGEAEEHRRALILLAQPDEPDELPVHWLVWEMEEIVGKVDLGHEVPTAKVVPHRVHTLHLEVFVPKVTFEGAKVQTTSHLYGILLRDGEEGALQLTLGVGWELFRGRRLQIMLKSGGACL